MRIIVVFSILIYFMTLNVYSKNLMTMVDLLNIPSLDDAQLSPNGEAVLFVKSDANWQENKNISKIWRINRNGKNLKQITSGVTDATSPRWSPDGKEILFLSKRDDDKQKQIYIIPADGGEAVRLSNHMSDVSSATWSTDGSEIYFLASDAKSDEEIKREQEQDDFFKFEQNYKQTHLWKINQKSGQEQQITMGDFSITDFIISHTSDKIIYHVGPNPLLDSALENEIWIMNKEGQNQIQITKNNNPEDKAELSPDGQNILYISWVDENDTPYFENNLFIVSSNGTQKTKLLDTFDHHIQDAHWSKDSKTIFFLANLGIHSELFSFDLKSRQITQLTDGAHTISNWHYSYKQDTHVFSITTPSNDGDFWSMKGRDKSSLKKITQVFDYLEKDFDLPEQTNVKWRGVDGVEIEGMLIYPNGYEKGKRYPLAVQTHGGPRSSDQWGLYSSTSYGPILAANGYVILRPNYRGSVGYGDNFVMDMVGGYFNNSHLDVMAGVDHLINLGIVDETKMVKMGYSAGGHMTNKLITFTDRFKAASSSAGTVNWISMYSQSDTRIYRTPWFGGTPWQEDAPIETYWNHSPLKDIANVKTPTLIIVGGADIRVPQQQSIELYRALNSNGVETDLYIAPREHHGWKELRHKLSKMNVEMSWFEKFVKNHEFKWEEAPKMIPQPQIKVVNSR
jgi:dipeptidyl aminopeptidase/acylaminoacyl peptidase